MLSKYDADNHPKAAPTKIAQIACDEADLREYGCHRAFKFDLDSTFAAGV